MDRIRVEGAGEDVVTRRACPEPAVLPSRERALATARAAVEVGGIVLMTGRAGVGKTWLWRRLRDCDRPARRWVQLDVRPGHDPATFPADLARMLGLVEGGTRVESPAWLVEDWLAERSYDGEPVVLVLDEAQNASPAMLEAVRILANRAGEPEGFAAIVLAGQAPLARRLTGRTLAPLGSRVAARVHLAPLDLDEAATWLAWRSGQPLAREEVERAHRDSSGIPALLDRWPTRKAAAPHAGPAARDATPALDPASPPAPGSSPTPGVVPTPSPAVTTRPIVGPDRPPVWISDGVVEVGWTSDRLDSTPDFEESQPLPAPAVSRIERRLEPSEPDAAEESEPDEPSEEAVADHYATLQAWSERADSARDPSAGLTPAAPAARWPADPVDDDSTGDRTTPGAYWVEGQQPFAPYSQLFTRLKRARDIE